MWLFTKHGFYSAVCARQGDGKSHRPVDPETIMVRARLESHLVALKDRFPELLVEVPIQSFPGSDYAYRIFLPKSNWSQILLALGDEIDYDNFKGKVEKHQGKSGRDYTRALHDVWAVMNELQNDAE